MSQTNELAFEAYVEEILLTRDWSLEFQTPAIVLAVNPKVNHGKPDLADLASNGKPR